MLRSSFLAVAAVLAVGSVNAFASVGEQTYIIDISATSSGNFDARMEFVDGMGPGDSGQVGIDIEDAGDYTGNYIAAGTVVTSYKVAAVAPDDGFFSAFTGVAVDLKQAGGPIGALAIFLELPGKTIGGGFSTSGDLFLFTGTEQLP